MSDKRFSIIKLFLKNAIGKHDQQEHTPDIYEGHVNMPSVSLYSRVGTTYSRPPYAANRPNTPPEGGKTVATQQTPRVAATGRIRNKPKKTKPKQGKPAKPMTQAEKDKEADRRRESEKVRNWKPMTIIPGGIVPSDKLPPKEKSDISAIAAKYIPPGVNDRLNPQTSQNLFAKLETFFKQGMAGDTASMKEALGILEAYAQLNGLSQEKFTADREVVYDSTANALLENKPGDAMADATYYEFDKLFGESDGGKRRPSLTTIAQLSGNLQRLYSIGLNIKPVRRVAGHSKPKS